MGNAHRGIRLPEIWDTRYFYILNGLMVIESVMLKMLFINFFCKVHVSAVH